MSNSSIPNFSTISCCRGCRPFAHNRRTRSSVSSPESVVRSMQVIARSSHAACHSFFTVLRATCDAARRSTALVFTRTSLTHGRSNGIPRFESSARPLSVAIAREAPSLRSDSCAEPSCSGNEWLYDEDMVHPLDDESLSFGAKMQLPTCNCTAKAATQTRVPCVWPVLPEVGISLGPTEARELYRVYNGTL